jgi:predicted transposase YbfD/YdcC
VKQKQKRNLLEDLKEITDFRKDTYKIEYPLHEILFLSLFGMIKGNTTFKDLHYWMGFNTDNEILKKLFKKKEIKTPSYSTLQHLLMNINNEELEVIFRRYFKKYTTMRNLSVDGKWLNGSDVKGQYVETKHKSVLNILDKDNKIVIAHKFIGCDKKSEIPAIQAMLDEKEIFSNKSQIFTFDAMMTQHKILNKINSDKNYYLAKVKGNQSNLKEDIIRKISEINRDETDAILDIYDDKDSYSIEGNNLVSRKIEVYKSSNNQVVLCSGNFENIQTIIKVTKTTINTKTKKESSSVAYLMANFRTSPKDFKEIIKAHWRVETYHYHLDMLMDEDAHKAYINPFSAAIFRSFAINLYQLFLNEHKGEKLLKSKINMAEIKRYCSYCDNFASDLFEL